jgi:hypothetical protein
LYEKWDCCDSVAAVISGDDDDEEVMKEEEGKDGGGSLGRVQTQKSRKDRSGERKEREPIARKHVQAHHSTRDL